MFSNMWIVIVIQPMNTTYDNYIANELNLFFGHPNSSFLALVGPEIANKKKTLGSDLTLF